MLLIKCTSCSKEFWIEGYTTANSEYEPGEIIVADKDPPETACECYVNGQEFELIDESYNEED